MRKLPEIFLARKQIGTFRENISPTLNKNLYILTKDLDLTTRTLNIFTSENIKYVGDLVQYSEKSLSKLPNMGVKSIDEINRVISDLSLYLGMNIVNWPPDELKELQNQTEGLHVAKIPLDFSQLNFLTKDLRDINLPTRACNALLNLDYNTMSDLLLSANPKELKRTPNFGNTSLESVEQLLASHNIKFGDSLEPWSEEIAREVRKIIDEELQIKRLETKSEDEFLEDELIRILNESIYTSKKKGSSKKDRVINVLINRFGLDGTPGKTLEIIGQKYNVTRERIRQNQQFGIRKLKISKPITPILNSVFKLLLLEAPITEEEFNKILKEKKISKKNWDFKALKEFYESFEENLNYNVSKINNIRIIYISTIENIFKSILVDINKKISSCGLFSLSGCMNLKNIYLNKIKIETVKKFIQTKPLFSWLDENKEYFTFFSKRNRLSNLISKVVANSDLVDLNILFNKIQKHPRINNEVGYNKEILLNFCTKCFDCTLENNNLIRFNSSSSKLSKIVGRNGNIIAPNEQKIIKILQNYGPILGIDDLREFSEKELIGKDF